MSILPVWLPVSLSAEPNKLPDPAQGRAIPRWNRLDKRNRSMKKNPASRAPRRFQNCKNFKIVEKILIKPSF